MVAVATGLCLTVGCGSAGGGGTGSGSPVAPDAGGGPAGVDGGSGGGTGGVDAGGGGGTGAVDAGSGGGTGGVDAGGGTGGVDAGSGGGTGGVDAGTADGGTVASECDGVAPSSIGAQQTWSAVFDGINGACGLAIANGYGTIAQMKTDMAAHPSWTFFDASTGSGGATYGLWHGDLTPQPVLTGGDSYFYSYVDEGALHFHLAGVSPVDGSSRAVTPSLRLYLDEHVVAADPSSGILVAGAIAEDNSGLPNRRRVLTNRGTFGPRDLERDAPVFGLGVDLAFHVLVIQAGDCSGCVSGQWFDGDGTPATGSFTLLTGFTPGANTWFETAPLLGGGLAVRRVDADGGFFAANRSTWLVTVAAGSSSPQPAPAWLASRPNTNLAPIRNRTAYALLPNGETGGACTQRLELVSRGGNSCAHYDLDLAPGTCDTSELRVGLDGTILQHTPTSLERNPYGRPQSCALRYWPAALR